MLEPFPHPTSATKGNQLSGFHQDLSSDLPIYTALLLQRNAAMFLPLLCLAMHCLCGLQMARDLLHHWLLDIQLMCSDPILFRNPQADFVSGPLQASVSLALCSVLEANVVRF